MGHVKGIGGLFFRSREPAALKAWYQERLGVGGGCSADNSIAPNEWVWNVTAGPLVFAPFKADSDYFPPDRQHMVNFRVDDLDAVLEPFRAAGEEIITKDEWNDPAIGRFARVHDPEGNPIELWEPPQG
ncbi:VOC family protein [Sphingopyxis sp. 113P3]|uniref:VOC family protein n=1 Tax=Sphingopyxis sp. (strain 113P3) TaxID=292913 RepID=UPI0006AD2C48|nr:glyoxalase/bleomycin resistance/dioxygenase family protein [Sphingopyxis sp. 113P3]ALC10989.1 glyoxalase [Sphingopyxis sp. 113P3]